MTSGGEARSIIRFSEYRFLVRADQGGQYSDGVRTHIPSIRFSHVFMDQMHIGFKNLTGGGIQMRTVVVIANQHNRRQHNRRQIIMVVFGGHAVAVSWQGMAGIAQDRNGEALALKSISSHVLRGWVKIKAEKFSRS